MSVQPLSPAPRAAASIAARRARCSSRSTAGATQGHAGDTLAVGAARERRDARRAELEVSPPARHRRGRRRGAERDRAARDRRAHRSRMRGRPR